MKKILSISSILALIAGTLMVAIGIWGIVFTYHNVAQEQIITPPDASIPSTPVRGPLTLKSQADIIRHHVLQTTGGKTYSQMPQKVQKMDESGQPVLDATGAPVLAPNEARTIWITATALTTALHLGIITYVFSGLMVLLGMISIWNGIVFRVCRNLCK